MSGQQYSWCRGRGTRLSRPLRRDMETSHFTTNRNAQETSPVKVTISRVPYTREYQLKDQVWRVQYFPRRHYWSLQRRQARPLTQDEWVKVAAVPDDNLLLFVQSARELVAAPPDEHRFIDNKAHEKNMVSVQMVKMRGGNIRLIHARQEQQYVDTRQGTPMLPQVLASVADDVGQVVEQEMAWPMLVKPLDALAAADNIQDLQTLLRSPRSR